MKKLITIVAMVLAVCRINAAESQKQTVCPVMGGKINTNLFVDAEGKRIYVCCPDCLPELKQNPAKYIRKLEQQGVKLDAAPKPADAKK
ncbi:MAG: hypothetical protein EPN23_00515 [Verrucomicrobia bacterium]|nr:MAG: hypothetical protein EPN23_00515 [Verrucomicrobiota bacterium]